LAPLKVFLKQQRRQITKNSHPKDISEVVAAGREDDLVGLDDLSLAGHGHVHEVLAALEAAQLRDDVVLHREDFVNQFRT
jgi:hypothetical protein